MHINQYKDISDRKKWSLRACTCLIVVIALPENLVVILLMYECDDDVIGELGDGVKSGSAFAGHSASTISHTVFSRERENLIT